MSMFEQYSGLIRLAQTMIATWLILSYGHPDRASAQTTATNQSSAAVENSDEEGTVATASLEEDAGLRLIRENIYVLRHQHLNRKEQWAAAIRTLVRIGPPAVPELIRELDRPNRSTTLRSLGFTLRAIGDPRAVPALIRAIPETLQRPGNDSGGRVFDDKLLQFMMFHDLDVKNEDKTTFWLELAEHEFVGALETLTGHSIPKDLQGREWIILEDDEKLDEQSRQIFAKWQAAWAKWWGEHYLEFVTEVELAEVAEVSVTDDPVERAGVAKFGPRFPTGRDVRLGPVREVVLGNDALMDSRCCFDFDRHRVIQLREGISEFPYTNEHGATDLWSQRSGVDCFSAEWRLLNFDLHIWQIENARWESIEQEVVSGLLLELGRERAVIQPLVPDESSVDPTLTTTFLFTTREGAQGILQMLPHSAAEPTTIRYRLWNDDGTHPAELSQPKPVESEEWTEEMTVTLHAPEPNSRFVAHLPSASALEVPAEVLVDGPMSEAAVRWYIDHGCDLRAEVDDVTDYAAKDPDDPNAKPPVFQVLAVRGRQMRTVPISGEGYSKLSVGEIRDLMTRWPREMQWAYLDGSRGNGTGFLSGKPFFHAFLTESKQVGVLTYATTRGETKSVTVKYRLSHAK